MRSMARLNKRMERRRKRTVIQAVAAAVAAKFAQVQELSTGGLSALRRRERAVRKALDVLSEDALRRTYLARAVMSERAALVAPRDAGASAMTPMISTMAAVVAKHSEEPPCSVSDPLPLLQLGEPQLAFGGIATEFGTRRVDVGHLCIYALVALPPESGTRATPAALGLTEQGTADLQREAARLLGLRLVSP